jgi:Pentapeptide repeats (8 copies)
MLLVQHGQRVNLEPIRYQVGSPSWCMLWLSASPQGDCVADNGHIKTLRRGVAAWNRWRTLSANIKIDLSHADLKGMNLHGANLSKADLSNANLFEADLSDTNLTYAQLRGADLRRSDLVSADLRRARAINANFSEADLVESDLRYSILKNAKLSSADLSNAKLGACDLSGADLSGADLTDTDLTSAKLGGADLSLTKMVRTNLNKANLEGSLVYGISAWDVQLTGTNQSNLIITPDGQLVIQVDNLQMAQFIYLLLNNQVIRDVIDTITSKLVLILGRFTPQRKSTLDAIRSDLRSRGYLPVLFDFEKPNSKNLTETVSTLANMALFIIADLTNPSSVPHELSTIVAATTVPVQAVLLNGQREYSMFVDLRIRYNWVMKPFRYKSTEHLLSNLSRKVILPAETMAKQLIRRRGRLMKS